MEFKQIKVSQIIRIIPILLGAAAGYAYYHYVGCVTGTCPISSNPWSSTIMGAVIGWGFIPRKKKSQNETKKETEQV